MGHRTLAVVTERLVWLLAVLVSLVLLGDGLEKNFFFENTEDALHEAAIGVRMIWASCLALTALSAYAWWRGAPAWCSAVTLSPPAVSGGLMAVWPESLFPQLTFLLVGPLAGIAALAGAFLRWKPRHQVVRAVRPEQ
jgi:hypothetical protein